MTSGSAVVVGAGIGGLCAAIGLRRRGWDVTVLERAPVLSEVGAGLTLMPNGLRALDALGVGDLVRRAGRFDAPGGLRTSSGRWLTRVDAEAVTRLLGDAALGIHRATLHRLLRDALPPEVLVLGVEVVGVTPGPPAEVELRCDGVPSRLRADLVVAADGVHSAVRTALWPAGPSPRSAGSTAWRGVTTGRWDGEPVMAVSWDRGREFGMVPLGDGRMYWYGAVVAPAGHRAAGGHEMAVVRALFGRWHRPVPQLLDATAAASVLRNDIVHLDPPLRTYHRGAVALLGDAAHAMTPHLGQGANQAAEDAAVLAAVCDPAGEVATALVAYDAQRRPRSQAVARASRRVGRLGQELQHPVAVRLRNTATRLTPPHLALQALAGWADWSAPDVPASA